jgi:superfamily II DNA or RNA helicase
MAEQNGHPLFDVQLEAATCCFQAMDVTLQLGCNTGKTAGMLLTAAQYKQGILSPTKALVQSIAQTCHAKAVNYLVYTHGNGDFPSAFNRPAYQRDVRVVVVVYDSGFSFGLIGQRIERNLLNRIVVDEAHTIVDSYRKVMSTIRSFVPGVPMTLMSGTLPGS